MKEENKFVLNFYDDTVFDLNIKSGMLRDFINDLEYGYSEKVVLMRKLELIRFHYSKIQDQRNNDNSNSKGPKLNWYKPEKQNG